MAKPLREAEEWRRHHSATHTWAHVDPFEHPEISGIPNCSGLADEGLGIHVFFICVLDAGLYEIVADCSVQRGLSWFIETERFIVDDFMGRVYELPLTQSLTRVIGDRLVTSICLQPSP